MFHLQIRLSYSQFKGALDLLDLIAQNMPLTDLLPPLSSLPNLSSLSSSTLHQGHGLKITEMVLAGPGSHLASFARSDGVGRGMIFMSTIRLIQTLIHRTSSGTSSPSSSGGHAALLVARCLQGLVDMASKLADEHEALQALLSSDGPSSDTGLGLSSSSPSSIMSEVHIGPLHLPPSSPSLNLLQPSLSLSHALGMNARGEEVPLDLTMRRYIVGTLLKQDRMLLKQLLLFLVSHSPMSSSYFPHILKTIVPFRLKRPRRGLILSASRPVLPSPPPPSPQMHGNAAWSASRVLASSRSSIPQK